MFQNLQNINSNGYLWLFFFASVLDVLLTSGITYGWAGIVYVFKVELFFIDLCPSHGEASTNNDQENEDKLPGCVEQDSRLQLIFTVALFVQSVTMFISGTLVDRYGPKLIRAIGGAIYIIGCFGLAFINKDNANLLFLVFTVIMIGSQFLCMAIFQTTNIIFRRYRAAATSFVFGAYDSSAVVLLLFKIIYKTGYSLKEITICYLIIVFLWSNFVTILLIPFKSLLMKWNAEEMESMLVDKSTNSVTYIVEAQETMISHNQDAEQKSNIKNEKTPLMVQNVKKEEASLKSHICSPFYILHVFFLCVFQLKLWYYVGTMTEDLTQLSHDRKELSQYIDIFGYCQFGGLLVSPILALMLDKDKLFGKSSSENTDKINSGTRQERIRNCVLVFSINTLLCIILSIALPFLKVQVLSFIVYMIVRAFLYGSNGIFIGAAFPATYYGTLFGIGMLVAAIFGALQYPLFEMRSRLMDNKPLGAQLILFGLVLCACVHPIHMFWRTRDTEKNRKYFQSDIDTVDTRL